MADDIDVVNERELKADKAIHSIRYDIPKGISGECEECEEYSPRLIDGVCAFCRDGRTR